MRRKSDELTIAEVARLCDYHPNTVRRWTAKGIIICRRDIKNYRKYSLSEALKLKRFLNAKWPDRGIAAVPTNTEIDGAE